MLLKTKNQLLITGAVLLGAAPASAQYIEIAQIMPGQGRYASLNVTEKVNQAKKKGGIIKRLGRNARELQLPAYDSYRSILPAATPLPVVKGPEGYVLVDGHHDVLASLKFGAKTVPIKVVGDLSTNTVNEFWQIAEKKGWVYPYAIGGAYQRTPKLFSELVDDPNRYLAAIIARKCLDERTETKNTIGADYPVWVKVGKDIPFIEFKIADALYKNGFTYNLEHGDTPTAEDIEKAREILTNSPVPGLRVLKKKTYYSDLPLLCTTHAAQE